MKSKVSSIMKELRPALLHGVADRVEPHHAHAVCRKDSQDVLEVADPFRMVHVDVDLLGRERRPEDALRAVGERHGREGQAGSWAIDREQVLLAGAVREYAVEGQEQAVVAAAFAVRGEVQELGRAARNVIDDDVGHHVDLASDRAHVFPGAEALIHFGVIDRVEAGIRAVDRMKEREQVHPTEQPRKRSLQQLTEPVQCAAESVGVRDELNLILHWDFRSIGVRGSAVLEAVRALQAGGGGIE